MNKVSIIGKELEKVEDMQGYYPWKDPVKTGAAVGSIGGLFGALLGLGIGKDKVLKY